MSKTPGSENTENTETPPAPTPPSAFDWSSHGLEKDDLEVVTAKSWKSPGDAIKAYRGAQKLLGGGKVEDLVRLPAATADPSEWRQIAQRLGVPEKPDGYTLPEGMKVEDEAFLGFARDLLHGAAEHGAIVPDRAFPKILEKWNAYAEAQQTAAEEQFASAQAAAVEKVKAAWGQQYEANLRTAIAYAEKAGFTTEDRAALERIWGTEALMTRFYALGKGLGEHAIVESGGTPASEGSPAGAKAVLSELRSDRDFMARLTAGEPKAKERWRLLHETAFGTEAIHTG